jgi:hypothetical protein
MSAGIPSIQTIHGSSLEYLLMRVTEIFQIPTVLLRTSVPHLLIEMRAFWHQTQRQRRVTRIAEIITLKQGAKEMVHIQDIFRYNPQTDQLERLHDLATTTTKKTITQFRPLPSELFQRMLQSLTQIMRTHTSQSFIELNRVINTLQMT